jgi:hypothetical protein
MSEWDQYKVSGIKPSVNEWDQYKVSASKPQKTEKGDAWLPLIGKSALKGATAIADLPKLIGKGVEAFTNAGNKMYGAPVGMYGMGLKPTAVKPNIEINQNAPQTNYSDYIPSTEDARKSFKKYAGIDLEPKPDSPAKNIVSRGIDFGTSMLPWAAPAKGANLLQQFGNRATTVGKGAAVGLGSGVLQETGVNPLASDLIASAASPVRAPNPINVAKGVLNAPRKITQKFMGLGPKSLNIKTAQAGRDLGIELPAAVLTDNVLTGLGDQFISKTPILGNVLKNKYDKIHSKTHKHLEDVYQEIGPLDTPEIDKKINDLYNASRTARPEDAVIKPFTSIKALNDLDKTLVADISSPDRVKLKGYVTGLKKAMDPSINTKYGDINLPIQDYPINKLVDAKVMLNDIVKHDIKGDSLNRIMEVKHGVDADLAKYGETHPEWYKKLKEADLLYGNVAKRKNTEKRLRNQATLEDEGDISFSALNNTINNRENRRLLKRDLPPDTYEKLLKIGRISRAMVQKNKRVPNPSGTATTALSLAYIGGLWFDPVGTLSRTGIGAIAGAVGTTRLLTNKKFLDSALKFAEADGKHKIKAAMDLNKTTKDITGYTLNSIYRAAQRDNKEETDGLQQP